ncbi:hypothetical protein CPIN18021_0245 [Campylobacter pinnipediorum subsp. caledonicus]|uniref:Uncharacterized protein n=1 Tax=Campylobacter pinnipediorum subsp. caledonicus TaxID=1874362 RepID=A0A1S6U5X4_9BACT|nr:hypothetical protein [Campylobacter pinnipediorum]AQW87092.1 hypothetical protein CPIN18021_0245 [Campylobacter pinnipediorum subsp. caledonicus]
MKCPIKETIAKSSKLFDDVLKQDNWDKKVDKLFEIAGKLTDDASVKIAQKNPQIAKILSLSKYGREINNILDDFTKTKMGIYAHAKRVRDNLSQLNKDESKLLFKAMDGEIESKDLPDYLKQTYATYRKIIDDNATDLVKAGALSEDKKLSNYIKRYYEKHLKENEKTKKLLFDEFKARKDLTYDQRVGLKMIEDSSFAISKTIAEQKVQLLRANILKTFADRYAGDKMADGLVRISDETVGGGIKKYGALAGKYVPEDIANAVKEADLISGEIKKFNHWYYKLIDHIKVNVTVKNPFTHLYNFGSNFMLSYLHGDLKYLAKTLNMLATDKKAFDKLVNEANGVGLNSMLNDLEGIKDLKVEKRDGIFWNLARLAYFSEGSKTGDAIRKAYDWEDKFFKLARYKKNIDAGMSPKEAMKDAQYAYVDYSTHFNGTLRWLDKSGIMPFLHYSVKSSPMVLKTIMKNPGKFMLLQAGLVGFGASSFFGDNEKENLFKPSWADSNKFPNVFGIKSFMDLGNGWYLNSGRLVPGFRFDGFDKLELSGGFAKGIWNVLAEGKSTLGYSFEKEDDGIPKKMYKRIAELTRNYLPPLTFGRYGQDVFKSTVHSVAPDFIDAPKSYNKKDDASVGEILSKGVGFRKFQEQKEAQQQANKLKKEYKKSVEERDYNKQRDIKNKLEEYKKYSRAKNIKLNLSLEKERR